MSDAAYVVSNLPIFGHFCHPIFAHKSTKKAAEASSLEVSGMKDEK